MLRALRTYPEFAPLVAVPAALVVVLFVPLAIWSLVMLTAVTRLKASEGRFLLAVGVAFLVSSLVGVWFALRACGRACRYLAHHASRTGGPTTPALARFCVMRMARRRWVTDVTIDGRPLAPRVASAHARSLGRFDCPAIEARGELHHDKGKPFLFTFDDGRGRIWF